MTSRYGSNGRSADVVVVGGGAVGASVALELTRRGADVLLLERGTELALGCSFGSAGLICPSHISPLANPRALREGAKWMFTPNSPLSMRPDWRLIPWLARFVRASTKERARRSGEVLRALADISLEMHYAYRDEGIDTGFVNEGILYVYEKASSFAHAKASISSSATTVLEGHEIGSLDPRISRDVVGAIYLTNEGHCDGRRFATVVADAAGRRGASTRVRSEVRRLLVRRDRVYGVETQHGAVPADTIVLACGVWTEDLLREHRVKIFLAPGKGYHVQLPLEPGDAPFPVYLHDSRVIATPLGRRLRLAGTLALGEWDESVPRRRIAAIRSAVARVLPATSRRDAEAVWAGLRPCVADGLPVIGRTERLGNLVIATGHGMSGVALAPITGRLVAEMIVDEATDPAVEMLSPDRLVGHVPKPEPNQGNAPTRSR